MLDTCDVLIADLEAAAADSVDRRARTRHRASLDAVREIRGKVAAWASADETATDAERHASIQKLLELRSLLDEARAGTTSPTAVKESGEMGPIEEQEEEIRGRRRRSP